MRIRFGWQTVENASQYRINQGDRKHTRAMAKTPAAASAKPPAKSVGKATAPAKALVSAKASAPIKATPATKLKSPGAELPASAIKRLEADNVRLAKALKDADARIADLERQRDNALDRIEWVIDSLHSLRDDQG